MSVVDTYYVTFKGLTPVGAHTGNASLSSAVTLTPPATATAILAQALTANVRYTLDGTTPTASVGFQLKAGDSPVLIDVAPGLTIKVIQEASGADLEYQWVRY